MSTFEKSSKSFMAPGVDEEVQVKEEELSFEKSQESARFNEPIEEEDEEEKA